MPPRRHRAIEAPVHLTVDGRRLVACEGEPVAVALTAAGRLVLGRSVKYHRARGAACYAGRCDGCLMRVDGVQSVMTCQVAAKDGMRLETQNVLGSADNDLLAAADWFFPKGMNHHEMFTWSEPLNRVMKKVARRIAGIGELPDAIRPSPPSEPLEVDVLVVGGGPAGLAAATREAAAGHSVALVEESTVLGGAYRWWPGLLSDGSDPRARAERLITAARAAGVALHVGTSALGAYDAWEDIGGADGPAPAARRPGERAVVLLDSPEGARIARATRVVIAAGRHEGAGAFRGSDRPGVIGARAACVLFSHGVLPGEDVVLAGAHPALEPLAAALRDAGARVTGPVPEEAVLGVDGGPEVEECALIEGGRGTTIDCDCLVIAPPASATYELAAQLGAEVRWVDDRYELGATPTDVELVGWAREFTLEAPVS